MDPVVESRWRSGSDTRHLAGQCRGAAHGAERLATTGPPIKARLLCWKPSQSSGVVTFGATLGPRMLPTLLSIILLASTSHASTGTSRGPGDSDVVSHPFGELRGWAVRGFCRSELVFVGTISESDSFWRTFSDQGSGAQHQKIVSDVQFTVESAVRGAFDGSAVRMTVDGGKVGETVVKPDPAMINPVVGYRYAVGFNVVATPAGPHPVIQAIARLDPEQRLPAELPSEFESASAEHCGTL